MIKYKEAINSLIRTDFYAYIQKVFYESTGGETFIPNWHLELICDTLEKCRRKEIKRLIINVPPRSLKSIIVNIGFSSWLLGHNPTEKIVSVSYSQELSEKFARDTKTVMNTEWYGKAFPRTMISKDRHSAYDFNTTKRGGRFSTSVEGTLTGRGGNWIIIDDPIKPGDIMSENNIEKVNDWYKNTLLSRLDNKEEGVIIVIMQRVHENDLSGYLLNNENGWYHLRIPAIAEEDELWKLSNGKNIIRKAGAVLNSKQLSKKTLKEFKTQMGAFVFSGQYQQNPAPLDGGLIKKEWFKYYNTNELPEKFKFIIHSWDTASKTEEINAYSVCTTWGISDDYKYYLLNVYRARLEMPDLVDKAIFMYNNFKNIGYVHKVFIEDKSSGTQLIQILNREKPGIIIQPIKPEGDKITRFRGASVKIERGNVLFPETKQGWWADFENELMRFPNTKYKDQVDSLSQALNEEISISIFDVL